MQSDAFYPIFVGMAAFLIGNGPAIVRAEAPSARLGRVAAAAAAGVVAATPISWFMTLVLPGWSLVVSVLVFIRGAQPAETPVPAPSTA
jgi:hypothetical protein